MANRARQVAFVTQRATPFIHLYLSLSAIQIRVKAYRREFRALRFLARKLVSYLDRVSLPKKAGVLQLEVLQL